MSYSYTTKLFSSLTPDELSQCSSVFSLNYGIYSENAPKNVGENIKMSPNFLKKSFGNSNNVFISVCKDNGMIVGQAIFVKGKISNGKTFCWVSQLVVAQIHRLNGIAEKLLTSAWCFSDIDIRGLATANAITLNILETVSWRHISISSMLNHISEINEVLDSVPFMSSQQLQLGAGKSQIFSDFYPTIEKCDERYDKYPKLLGPIEPGNEWCALVFNDQQYLYDEKKFRKYLEFSEDQLRDSYNRMDIKSQPWAKGAREEMTFLKKQIKSFSSIHSALDLGCGIGRHSIELSILGVPEVTGVDLSETQISRAVSDPKSIRIVNSVDFKQEDARTYYDGKKYDLILCLYDVIGSYPDSDNNMSILTTIKKHLSQNGIAVISVMNFDATDISTKSISIRKEPERLLNLQPSSSMEGTGDIFDGQFIFNFDNEVFYRKEKFVADNGLFSEYLIATKRYTKDGFSILLEKQGFEIVKSFYASAGSWGKSMSEENNKQKEIVFIVKKARTLRRLSMFFKHIIAIY